ncbi:glycosyltransferase family 2 protein [Stappia sp. ES.058]|uniref:glycosyltransferase family 2 protein n=1 Tax=Stappia sp. ES.058 TaxID=1881061 RepID=UPI0012FDF47F|nr:glycosyltransferase [Stappia sp. ES.058]
MAGASGCRSRFPARPGPSGPLPVYSVLVPLYREVRVAPVLAAALGALEYPRGRLEILFLLEADDHETRSALAPLLSTHMRIVIVPPGEPRTKPRALCHGLAVARGELIAVYDGEDRPEPDQLRLASARFAELPDRVAALQAHLAVDHASHRVFARQFRLEYAGLFDCLLPWLSSRGWPFPLGGTSNHFRRGALEAVGGWDPFNVTEDADLSMRLSRAGYGMQTLASTTFEEAPLDWRAWHAQRTRWLKGWLQTLLVNLRDPVVLAGQMRKTRVALLLIYLVGMVVTLAAHPVFLLVLMAYGSGISPIPLNTSWQANATLSLAGTSVGLAYGSMTVLAFAGARTRGHWPPVLDLIVIPLYWLMQSVAFYAAVVDLVRRPHSWSKTEHGLARRPKRLPNVARRTRRRA